MTDREKFLATIKDQCRDPKKGVTICPATAILVFADWLREQGEWDLAYAYEWAARRGRFPFVSLKGRSVWWSVQRRSQRKPASPHQLPAIVAEAFRPKINVRPNHRSIDFAFVELAKALKRLREVVSLDPTTLH